MSSILINANSGTSRDPLNFRVMFNQPLVIPKHAQVQIISLRLALDKTMVSTNPPTDGSNPLHFIQTQSFLIACDEFGSIQSHIASHNFGTPSSVICGVDNLEQPRNYGDNNSEK